MSAFISISEAAKYAGISRTTLYKKYLDKGVITVKKVNNYPKIDVADLIRVFGDLNQPENEQCLTEFNNNEQFLLERINELESQIYTLKSENEKLKALNEAQERHITDMRRGFDLIEHATGKSKRWWRFWS